MDPYHRNVYFCHKIETQADALERHMIACYLLDMGIRPPQNIQVMTHFEENLSDEVEEHITHLRRSTANIIFNKLKTGIRSLECLSRGIIIKSLRASADEGIITNLLEAITEKVLPRPCLNFLKFKDSFYFLFFTLLTWS